MPDENAKTDEGLTAEELGEQSIYEGETEMQRRILRGDETKGDSDARDTAGATAVRDTDNERTDRDTPHRASETAAERPEK